MDILLPHFKLEKIDFFSENHISYIQELIYDEDVQKYLPYFRNGIYISRSMGLLNTHYVVFQGEKRIGYVFLTAPFKEKDDKNAEIRYIVDPNFRNQGLGKMIIKESSDYILDNEEIDNLRAFIDPENIGSRKIIEYAGFEETDENCDGIGYTKPKGR
ncbi:MAG: GNAT family N-acetyltransferase [Firmicutes bacterium]|nr:GNAT family N-acetyltransferase [Bacillota bacterium]